jgi:hypothetical protein
MVMLRRTVVTSLMSKSRPDVLEVVGVESEGTDGGCGAGGESGSEFGGDGDAIDPGGSVY